MADYLPPVIAKLIADTSEHDRKWAESARTVKRAARDMDSSATRTAATHRDAAGQVGSAWKTTSTKIRDAAREASGSLATLALRATAVTSLGALAGPALAGGIAAVGALGAAGTVAALAFSGVGDAVKEFNKALESGDYSAYEKALSRMPASQAKFTREVVRTQQEFKRLKTTAADTALPGVGKAVIAVRELMPTLDAAVRRTGTILSGTGGKFATLISSKTFKKDLDGLLSSLDVVTQAASDSLVTLTGRLVKFGAEMKPATAGFATFLGDLTAGATGFLDGLGPHADDFKSIWESLGSIIKDLGPIAGDFFGDLAETWAPILKDAAEWLRDNKDQVRELASGLAKATPAIAAAALALKGFRIAAAGLKILKEIKDWAKPVKGVLDEVGDAADRNGPKVDGFRTKIGKLLKSVGKGALKGGAVVGGLAVADEFLPEPSTEPGTPTGPGSGYDGLKDITGGANQLITNPGSVFTEIGDEFDGMTEKFRNGEAPIQQWWSSYQTWVGQLPEKTRAWFTETKDAAVGKFIELRDGANQKTQEIVDGVTGWFRELPGRARDWLGRMKDAASQKGQEFLGWVRELPGRITGSLGDLGNLLWDKGKSLVEGLWGGIQSMGNWLYTNVWNWVKRVLPQPIKDALRIASPSKVAYDLASWVPEGMADALDDGTGIVAAASRRTAAAAVSGLHAQPALPIASPAIGPSVVPSITVNVAGHVLTERQLLDLIRKLVLQDSLRNTGNGLTLVGG